MAEYAKKLHIRKNGVVTDIKLYSTTGEVGANYLGLRDGSNVMYAKASAIGSANSSDLMVRKASSALAVLTQATLPYAEVTYITPGTYTFTVPQGVSKIRAAVIGGGGGSVHYLNSGTVGGAGGTSQIIGLLNATGGGGGVSKTGGSGGSPNGANGNGGAVNNGSTLAGGQGFNLDFSGTHSDAYGNAASVHSTKPTGNYTVSYVATGGGGGYNSGYFNVNAGDTLTVVVGAKGSDNGRSSYAEFKPVGHGGAVIIAYGVGVE